MSVARTILEQLGGNQFSMMTGAKNFVGSENSLSFKIGRNHASVNAIHIEYEVGSDTYNIEFLRVSVRGRKVVREVSGAYFSDLRPLFETVTGMRTKLF